MTLFLILKTILAIRTFFGIYNGEMFHISIYMADERKHGSPKGEENEKEEDYAPSTGNHCPFQINVHTHQWHSRRIQLHT
jgi:hypothetical protein